MLLDEDYRAVRRSWTTRYAMLTIVEAANLEIAVKAESVAVDAVC